MIVTMSRQDLQGVVDYAKNRIIERLVTKGDIQYIVGSAFDRVIGDLEDVRKANLPYIKQNLAITDQLWHRVQSVDSRLAGLEQSIRELTQVLNRVQGQQTRTASTIQRY